MLSRCGEEINYHIKSSVEYVIYEGKCVLLSECSKVVVLEGSVHREGCRSGGWGL